jgi:hypothetical protein
VVRALAEGSPEIVDPVADIDEIEGKEALEKPVHTTGKAQ